MALVRAAGAAREASLLANPPRRALSSLRAAAAAASTHPPPAAAASAAAPQEQTQPPDARFNVANIQMLDSHLWQQIYMPRPKDMTLEEKRKITSIISSSQSDKKAKIEMHLRAFDLWGRTPAPLKPTPLFNLPPLEGKSIEEHFVNVASRQCEPYRSLAVMMAGTPTPPMPKDWVMQHGWTRYNTDGTTESVPCPLEDAVVFDVETCVAEGKYPTLAVAVTPKAWYGWVSKKLCDYDVAAEDRSKLPPLAAWESRDDTIELIPLQLEDKDQHIPKLVIGHSVSYDRQRVKEEYCLFPQSKLRYMDTMSMHMATSGLSSQQLPKWSKNRSQEENTEGSNDKMDIWMRESSPLSLKESSKLWLNRNDISKQDRDYFVEGSLKDIKENFKKLMKYCANDVEVTHALFSKQLDSFLYFCSHPVTFAGMLTMGSPYLPVDETWLEYINGAQKLYDEFNDEVNSDLKRLAEEAVLLNESGAWKDDPWLKHLDWTTVPQKYTKAKLKKDGTYAKGGEPRPITSQKLPGKPEWYKKVWKSTGKGEAGEIVVTYRNTLAPYLYRLEWVDHAANKAYPLYHDEEHKWGYLVPKSDQHVGIGPIDWKMPDGTVSDTHDFFKLPHKDGPTANCGNPLSKEYSRYFKNGTLRSQNQLFTKALRNSNSCSYWSSANARITSQFVVWEDLVGRQNLLGGKSSSEKRKLGVILPFLVAAGTVTRRAVEKTWLTASNPKETRIGSELKTKVIAPPGYKIVGADVDSQELWIAAVLGDAQFAKESGSTAFGWMTLQGTKADGTDMHSRTAKILGITRDQAKIFNYGRIYGAGESFAKQLLRQFNPKLSEEEAAKRARDLYAATKGIKQKVSETEVGTKLSKKKGKASPLGNTSTVWQGGSESEMFNCLERIANEPIAKTPVLNCHISAALQAKNMSGKNDFLTSRINWVVQSSAVDYLHLMLVSMQYLCDLYDIKARLCITIHDEVRYIVADEDVNRAAFALHLTNLFVRSMFTYKLELYDLPQSVAFFSAVDIDKVLRKEVTQDCITPSQKTPIPHGETVDVFQAGERVGWTLEKSL